MAVSLRWVGGSPASSSPKPAFCSTVRCGISAKDWNTMLMCLRRSARSALASICAMSWPSNSTWPAVGSIRRLSSRTSVDLPEPDRPMTTKISPSCTAKLASLTPSVWPVRSKMAALSRPSRTRCIASCGRSPKTL